MLISVIIPYYNDGLYIDEAVDSILAQTYKDVEILIVNDGSTEAASIQKLNAYHKPKTRVLHKENGHLSSARNFGFQHTSPQSRYILVLDADDKFRPTFIEQAKEILDSQSVVGAVAANAELFGKVNQVIVKYTGGDSENFVYRNNAVACALIRREVWEQVDGYDETMKEGFEDWDFWLSTLEKGWRIHVIQEPLFLYRQKEVSMLQSSQLKRPELVKLLVNKHPSIFCQHVEKAIYEREKAILTLKAEIAHMHTRRYKIAQLVRKPLAWLQKS